MSLEFEASGKLDSGSYELLSVQSSDNIRDLSNDVVIRELGDVNGDGNVNTRDIAMMRQYVVGLVELSDIQLSYCNVYADYDENGKPIVNTRDVALLQQYVVGLVDLTT